MNVDEAMAIADNYRIWLSGGRVEMNSSEIVAITLATEVERLRDELAAAKAASVCPVKIVGLSHTDWGFALNVRCRSEDDSNVLWRWLRDRMKERGEG